jgi:hypothetical protein
MKEMIVDWCEFCEGKKIFDKSYFHTLFWEDINSSDLKLIFKYFPNSDALFNLMNDYLFEKSEKVSESKINETLIELALSDIQEKKFLLNGNSSLVSMVDNINVEFVDDYLFVANLCNSSPYLDFFDAISDVVLDNWIIEDKKTYALYEAFYGLTKSYEITWELFQPLLSIDTSLGYYIRFVSLGGVYSFLGTKLLVSKRMQR